MVFDPFGIIQLRILLYFVGIVTGWFSFYFLIGALRRIEEFTGKKTDWKFIYISLPMLLISPIAELQSYYLLDKPLTGLEGMIASGFFTMSSLFLLTSVYSFKKHLNIKMMSTTPMAFAFLVFLFYNLALLLKISNSIAFASMLLYSLAFFFFASSLWIVSSYTKEFHTIYPMQVFLLSAGLILLLGQIVKSFAFANHFLDLEPFTMLNLGGDIFIFIGLMVAAISTYVFKKTVIEFKLKLGASPPREYEKSKKKS